MKIQSVIRFLTPSGWIVLGATLLIAVVAAGHGLGLRWDPLDLSGRRLRAVEARAASAFADAGARRLEVEGMDRQARRLDHAHQQTVATERATARVATQARNAHDASHPLDSARADRLRRHDGELCRLNPSVCGAAAAEAAGSGRPALPAGPAS